MASPDDVLTVVYLAQFHSLRNQEQEKQDQATTEQLNEIFSFQPQTKTKQRPEKNYEQNQAKKGIDQSY